MRIEFRGGDGIRIDVMVSCDVCGISNNGNREEEMGAGLISIGLNI